MEMEHGSGGSSSSGGTLDGLAFGKKIYYEDSAAAAGSAELGDQGRSKGKGAAVPMCQVEGCNVDLSAAKAYYGRHKVCPPHSKTPRVVVAGVEQRFCQQCSRFHLLPEFDLGKRSCRRRLAGHNERRRKPPRGPFSSRYGRLAAYHEDHARFRSFLLDFSYPRVSSSARDFWPNPRALDPTEDSHQWLGSLDPHYEPTGAAYGVNLYTQAPAPPPFPPAPELPPVGLIGVSDSSCALSLLSTQPWGGHNGDQPRGTGISISGSYDGGNPMAPAVITSSCLGNSLCPQNEEHNISPHLEHPMRLSVDEGERGSRFSGELELALQGSRPRISQGSASAFHHPGTGMNWPHSGFSAMAAVTDQNRTCPVKIERLGATV